MISGVTGSSVTLLSRRKSRSRPAGTTPASPGVHSRRRHVRDELAFGDADGRQQPGRVAHGVDDLPGERERVGVVAIEAADIDVRAPLLDQLDARPDQLERAQQRLRDFAIEQRRRRHEDGVRVCRSRLAQR